MPNSNKVITNMAGGEVSPLIYGRSDLTLFQKAMATIKNFIAIPQGGARYRNGFQRVRYTRLNQIATFIPFQFSDQQSYLIEMTDKKFRFYKDEGVITETPQAITAGGVSNSVQATINLTAHGYNNGDEVFVTGVVGTVEVNDQFFLVANAGANTFTLTDIFGTDIDSTNFGVYVSGGTAARIYEIDAPFRERDFPFLQYTQNADTMYTATQRYEPRKIQRASHTSWTCATYVRTADPFVPASKTITGVTQANPGVVTSTAHGFTTGNEVTITGVVGMTQLNLNFYTVVVIDANTFSLLDLNGVAVDTSGFTAYANSGKATRTNAWPGAVCLIDSARLMFGGSQSAPETVWASKAPNSGAVAFDDFTNGVNPTDAFTFTLAPVHGKVDAIQSMTSTSKFIVLLTFGAIRRLYGATEQEPISPTNVTAKSVNAIGCARTIPVSNGESLFYVQRGANAIRSLEYDFTIDNYITTDRNLVTDHLTKIGVKQIVEQIATPTVIWAVRNDGVLLGMTHTEKEDISGWHQHDVGGNGKVLAIGVMPRPTSTDQLWLVVERTINGNTVRTVEFMQDEPIYPNRVDFNGVEDTEDDDDTSFFNAQYEVQKGACHLDSATFFDGSLVGTGITITFDGSQTITASAPVFDSTMVGRQIWKKYDATGHGGGRYKIMAVTDAQTITVAELVAFDTVDPITGGNWFLTANIMLNLHHLEGETVQVIADGGPPVSTQNDFVVANGQIDLGYQVSKCWVGYRYEGILRWLNQDSGGVTGSAEAKPRNLVMSNFRFLNTCGAEMGTDYYNLTRLVFRQGFGTGRPSVLHNGLYEQNYSDTWSGNQRGPGKEVYLRQRLPMPCTVLSADHFLETTDE